MSEPNAALPATLRERYLKLLGLRQRRPSLDALRQIVQAHLARIPFENVSKLHHMRRLGLRSMPSLEMYLEGIQRHHFGGTCYANNYCLYQLLADLGYQATLCGADMSSQDAHLVSMVRLDEREYLIDVGYAAPFREPMPRDLATDYAIGLGQSRYVLKPRDDQGCSRLELYRDGALKHGYLARPQPRHIEHFARSIRESYAEKATFMNALLLARYWPNRAVVIHNLTVTEYDGSGSSTRILIRKEDLGQAVCDHFQIRKEITDEVVCALGPLGDAWS